MVVDLTVVASGFGAAADGFVLDVLVVAEALVVLVTPAEDEVAVVLSVAGAETAAVVVEAAAT